VTDVLALFAQERNPSLPLALAATLQVAGADGQFTFGALAVAYRERHLQVTRGPGRVDGGQAGTLSMDEVRRFLASSVLPRLVTDAILASLPETLEDGTGLRVREEQWVVLAPEREALIGRLVDLAVERVAEAESPGAAPAPSGSILNGLGLTKVYRRRRVVDDVDVALQQGEIVGLLGKNGAGKTTTFYMIVGLLRPNQGRILLEGRDITDEAVYKRARSGLGYLAQEPSIFRRLSVAENVQAVLELHNSDPDVIREKLDDLLRDLNVAHLRASLAVSLSGGERRRVEIARALAGEPRFILLDEPFAGVDPIAVLDIQKIIGFLKARGIGVLITDHNVRETLGICDRAYIINDGTVLAYGKPEEIVYNESVRKVYLGEHFRL